MPDNLTDNMLSEAIQKHGEALAVLQDFEAENAALLDLHEKLKEQASLEYWGLETCTQCKKVAKVHPVDFVYDTGKVFHHFYCSIDCVYRVVEFPSSETAFFSFCHGLEWENPDGSTFLVRNRSKYEGVGGIVDCRWKSAPGIIGGPKLKFVPIDKG